MADIERTRSASGKRAGAPGLLLGFGCVITVFLSGCMYAEKAPLAERVTSEAELLSMAMDPLRPLERRVAAARLLEPANQRELEARLLDELPELFGLEWRERLALLGAIGDAATAKRLVELRESDDLPQSQRIHAAINRAIARIEERLEAGGEPANEAADAVSG